MIRHFNQYSEIVQESSRPIKLIPVFCTKSKPLHRTVKCSQTIESSSSQTDPTTAVSRKYSKKSNSASSTDTQPGPPGELIHFLLRKAKA